MNVHISCKSYMNHYITHGKPGGWKEWESLPYWCRSGFWDRLNQTTAGFFYKDCGIMKQPNRFTLTNTIDIKMQVKHFVLTSSLACLDQARLHTWEPVSIHCKGWEVRVFQNRMHRSAVPPPDARRPCWWGDQAMAFTAARCSVYCCTGPELELFHTRS